MALPKRYFERRRWILALKHQQAAARCNWLVYSVIFIVPSLGPY